MTDLESWLKRRIADAWFVAPPKVTVDRDEVRVVGELPAAAGRSAKARRQAESAAIGDFRSRSRAARAAITADAERELGLSVTWGARCGRTELLFSSRSLPVMTRLRQPERAVLDTLIYAGVARSRSDALAWCVRLVGRHEQRWIGDLRRALRRVEAVRARDPLEGDAAVARRR